MQQKFLFIEITNVCKNHKLLSNVPKIKNLKKNDDALSWFLKNSI